MSEIKVPFFKPSFDDEEKKAVCDVIDSGWLTTGKVTHDFECEFASFVGSKHALAVNSNTSGMILAMEACGVKAGKAVITTPYTFVSTAASAVHLGGDVFFADIEKDSYSIDPVKIEEILKKDSEHKICAIVPVHIAGNLCNMERICALAKKYSTPQNKIYVIEDAAHSFPSKTAHGYAGTLGDIGVFSFYATKTMTTGEGGMITTDDDALAKRMSQMRLHGMNRDAWDRYTNPKASWEYDIIAPGFKSNLPDILSAIGRVQLKKAVSFDEKRKKIVKIYNQAFKDLDFVILPPDGEGNAWHLYLLHLDSSKLDCDRNAFAKELQEQGIGISMHFIAIFNFTYWQEKYPDFRAENFPNADEHSKNTITLPLFPDMSEEQAQIVIKAVKEAGEKHHVR
ncbi:MAG: DegT/DnrJ/EryC1/StrS aminotransferase family protein [Treponema sp.]|uniref:DegT/DnrJ/EryC1/StrS family aminotransferase n=1 Tax=Treponema sp. TaxID=166 RepID=UPI0025E18456|nr:DegT/DnrJ/EryC1/StrS aminotransferase family protein [Treponema sp.]MBQ8680822.1 DegT/DnrJ/EryC1/StrS aminotransferase family protein [Treponema sp.]